MTASNPAALPVNLHENSLHIGPNLAVSFERTLRIPDDGGSYPLPPSLGSFPLRRVEDYADRVPESWRAHGGVFLPMYQREAMWLRFRAAWPPVALKVGVGKVNAISGNAWTNGLDAADQDYVVCPAQPWLDGINSGEGTIRQFVAMPLGMGYTVEGQITGEETVGGLQLMAFAARPERLPKPPPERGAASVQLMACPAAAPAPPSASMGLGAGGQMTQSIYPDTYGVEVWDPQRYGRVFVHIANSMDWREVTGEEPPATPVSARTYSEHGFPWFSLYDELRGDLAAAEALARVKSVKEMDSEKSFGSQQDNGTVEIPRPQVVELGRPGRAVAGGDW